MFSQLSYKTLSHLIIKFACLIKNATPAKTGFLHLVEMT